MTAKDPSCRLRGERRRKRVTVVLGALLIPALAAAQAAPDTGVAAAQARAAVLVQLFGGGSPLTASERAALDSAVRQTFTANPTAAQAAATDSAKMLALVQGRQGIELETAVQFGRKAIAFSYLEAPTIPSSRRTLLSRLS